VTSVVSIRLGVAGGDTGPSPKFCSMQYEAPVLKAQDITSTGFYLIDSRISHAVRYCRPNNRGPT
jgi:hypothetical protein